MANCLRSKFLAVRLPIDDRVLVLLVVGQNALVLHLAEERTRSNTSAVPERNA